MSSPTLCSRLGRTLLPGLACVLLSACDTVPRIDPSRPGTLRHTVAPSGWGFATPAPTASAGSAGGGGYAAMLTQAAELWTTSTPEEPGFAQYTYVLLVRETAATPEARAALRERNLALLRAALEGHDTSQKVIAGGTPRERINLEIVPVTTAPPGPDLAAGPDPLQAYIESVYARYDFNRAQAILTQRLALQPATGPYLVSSATPLWSSPTQPVAPICQDLSRAPLSMIVPWWQSFASKSSSPKFWKSGAGDARLSIRQALENLAQNVDGAAAGIKFVLAQISLPTGDKP